MASRMRERLTQLGGEDGPVPPDPNLKICGWCANRGGEACLVRCQPEAKYRYLSPEKRPSWEDRPALPDMREMVDWPAAGRLAMLWLVVHYQRDEE